MHYMTQTPLSLKSSHFQRDFTKLGKIGKILLWLYCQEEYGELRECFGSHCNIEGKASKRTVYHKMVGPNLRTDRPKKSSTWHRA